jgi:DNA adenine methylase
MPFHSPLRYPGGKSKISRYIQEVIDINKLNDGIYIEPFAGGAGLALNLLYNEYFSKVILNDLSKPIYSFWYSVINHTEVFCNLIRNTPVNMKEWEKQKEIQNKNNGDNILQLGFSTFFLNRTNRSGILNGGAIGGFKQSGQWKINARYNKEELIKRIRLIYQYADRIEIYNLEAMDFINKISKNISDISLFFIDPPYYDKGKYLYDNYYKNEDHKKLYEIISRLNNNWIVTYDDSEEISNMYKNCRQKKYSLNYTAAGNKQGKEIMIFSPKLVIPRKKVI